MDRGLLVLAGLATIVCLRIEWLNAENGYYLPRDFTTDPGQWRTSAVTNETPWRERLAARDPTILTQPLTPSEFTEMQTTDRKSNLRDSLQATVDSWGLMQYLLLPFLLIALPFNFRKHNRRGWRIAIGCAFIGVIACTVLMLYRGYFTSLGW